TAPDHAEHESAGEGDGQTGPHVGTDPAPCPPEHVQAALEVVPLLLDPLFNGVERLGDAAAGVLDRAPRFRHGGGLRPPLPEAIAPHGACSPPLPHTDFPCHLPLPIAVHPSAGVARTVPRRGPPRGTGRRRPLRKKRGGRPLVAGRPLRTHPAGARRSG